MSVDHLLPPNAPYKWPSMNMTRRAQACLFGAMRDMGYNDNESRHELLCQVLGEETFTILTDDDAWEIVAYLRNEGWTS
jgi:hypothetical protein